MTQIFRIAVPALAAIAFAAPALAQNTNLTDMVEAWLSSPHGDYASRSFTHWNRDGEVPAACAACHSPAGFIDYLGADGSAVGVVDHPVAIGAPVGCPVCHTSEAETLDRVVFPSGVTVDRLGTSAVCTVCHQGRLSGDAVVAATEGRDADTPSAELSFQNVHHAIAAAVMYGADVGGGFQYPGNDYAGQFNHVRGLDTCTSCHDVHTTKVEGDACKTCHRGVDDLRDIRMRHGDFDGDGRNDGGIHVEIAGLQEMLGRAIMAYAQEVSEAPIGYYSRYPYFFNDTDGDGIIGDDEAVAENRYASWTPRLLKAAYNYQFVEKDPGAYTHNPDYALQLLHDSIEDLSERVTLDLPAIGRP